MARPVRAVLWDLGGVILSSPFAAFAAFEAENGLPAGFLRRVNATNPDANAWARLERGEIDADRFAALFAEEARALGHTVDGARLLPLIEGEARPEMVAALAAVAGRYRTACLTNNVRQAGRETGWPPRLAPIMALFDAVIESSRLGIRKPDPRFYAHALARLDVAAEEAVYLDDLGINLKPARAMGMRTIKVADPSAALGELERHLGHPVG